MNRKKSVFTGEKYLESPSKTTWGNRNFENKCKHHWANQIISMNKKINSEWLRALVSVTCLPGRVGKPVASNPTNEMV